MNGTTSLWVMLLMLCSLLAACGGARQVATPTEAASQETSVASHALPNLLLEPDAEVELRRAGWAGFGPAGFGTVLRPGDLVRVAEGGQADVFCGDQASWSQGPRRLTGDGQEHGVPCDSGRPPRPWPDVAALRGPAEEERVYVVRPRNTALLSDRPDVVSGPSGTGANPPSTVSVLSDDGKERAPIRNVQWIVGWPDTWAPLQSGATYVLLASDEQPDAGTTLGRGFWLLDPSSADEVRDREAELRKLGLSQAAEQLLVSELYRSYGLHAEAIGLLRRLSEEVPSPPIWLNLGQAYLETGLPAEASESFEAALRLAEGLGDLPSAGEAHVGLALAAQLEDDAPAFAVHLEQARKIFEEVGDDQMSQEIERLTD